MAYLDNAATTAVLPEAAAAAMAAMTEDFGNPSSLHARGRRAREILEKARAELALALGCDKERVVFTSCGTESINTAVTWAAAKGRHRGMHIVSTAIEHDAVLRTLNELKGAGFEITLVPPERDGSVSLERLLSAMREDTVLVTLQAVNNETGAILPYAEAAREYKRISPEGFFHLDAIQAFMKRRLDLSHVDLVSLSAHKIGGMKGSGALYVKGGLKLRPLLFGGGQEGGLRSGTEAVPNIAAFGAACAYRRERMEESSARMAVLKREIIDGVRGLGGSINSPELSAEHIVNISMGRGRSEVYIRVLSDMGVYVSGGSACARGRSSHVLAAMRLPKRNIDAALRVSLCPENTREDAAALLQGLEAAAKMF